MKKSIVLFLIPLLFLFSGVSMANEKDTFYNASDEYLAAAACMAAYQDRYSQFIMNALEEDDWITEARYHATDRADLRYITAKKTMPGETYPTYLIAVAGTQTFKDVIADLNMHKVPFAGKTLKEFEDTAKIAEVPPETPMVHLGFHGYAQTLLTAQIEPYPDQPKMTLGNWLLQNKEHHLVLAGHSLGGATVTLAAARLVAMGVEPSQIKVITFGAPSIGNQSFSQQFEAPLNLTRFVTRGDPVSEAIQAFDHSYTHSRPAISLQVPNFINNQTHSILVYMDIAMKTYYDTRWAAQKAGLVTDFPDRKAAEPGQLHVYVAPATIALPAKISSEAAYMNEALLDEYREFLPSFVFGRNSDNAGEALREGLLKAAAENCQYYIAPRISGTKLRNYDEVYNIALEYAIYRVSDGRMVSAGAFSTSTFTVTPLEAFLHSAKTMRLENTDWLAQLPK